MKGSYATVRWVLDSLWPKLWVLVNSYVKQKNIVIVMQNQMTGRVSSNYDWKINFTTRITTHQLRVRIFINAPHLKVVM